MKTVLRAVCADWAPPLEAAARALAPLVAGAILVAMVIREGEALRGILAALVALIRWVGRLLLELLAPMPAGPIALLPPAAEAIEEEAPLPPAPAAPIRIPAAELLAAGGLDAAEVEAILALSPAPRRKRSKRPARAKAAARA